MSSPTSPNKKQKTAHVASTAEAAATQAAAADVVSDNSNTLLLPVTCLAAVLDFLPYPDVRNALLTGKAIAVEAASHIDCLNMTHLAGLNVPAARFRFPNVTRVNVTCLFSYDPDGNKVFSELAAMRTAPFLSLFTNLEVADMRNYAQNSRFKTEYYREPDDDGSLYRNMVNAFCGAFSANALPNDLITYGVVDLNGNCLNCTPAAEEVDTSSPCQLCRRICKCFPLKTVLRLSAAAESWRDFNGGDICISEATKLNIIQNRPGGSDLLGTQTAIEYLFDELFGHSDILTGYRVRDDSFKERMIRLGANADNLEVVFIRTGDVKLAQSLSIIAKRISSDYFMAQIKRFYEVPDNCRLVIEKRTSDMLMSAGYPLDRNAIIVVDCEQEPALTVLLKGRD